MKDWALFGALLLCGLSTAGVRAQPDISDDVWRLAQRVRETLPHEKRPFAIVDKRAATLAVFHANGHLAGLSAALLGRDRGDTSAAGVGERAQHGALRPGDATTPAGRFFTQPGHNHTGETVVWLDLPAAFAIHRLRPGASHAARARRLASADPHDNRVSEGCVVVPEVFFRHVVLPVLGRQPATVYVLPEAGLTHAHTAALLQDP